MLRHTSIAPGTGIIRNGIWGVTSNIAQVVLVSLFFIILARKYGPDDFGRFLVASTIYQLIAAFSSMGLGQWFIRQYALEKNKVKFTGQFLKTQIGLGFIFYLVNIALAYLLYPNEQIRTLCILLGTNIIFDNLISALKNLNIAEERQKKTAGILVMDGCLKLLIACLLLFQPFSTMILSGLLIAGRLITSGFFIRLGTNGTISIKSVLSSSISFGSIQKQVLQNWQFIVIGSISIIYWRIGNILISKALTLQDVANYEIAFRMFSVFQIIPIVVSATLYPQFITYVKEENAAVLKQVYALVFFLGAVFSLSSYAFIYSFGPIIIPAAFGNGYPGAAECLQQMFFTFLLLPTLLLQASLIVAMGLEIKDMWYNIASLVISVSCSIAGLIYFKSLAVVNYSILFSFLVFHLCQDVLLVRRKIITAVHCFTFYSVTAGFAASYILLSNRVNPFALFSCFLIVTAIITTARLIQYRRRGANRLFTRFQPVQS